MFLESVNAKEKEMEEEEIRTKRSFIEMEVRFLLNFLNILTNV